MDISESINCNYYNINKCEAYLSLKKNTLKKYFSEIENDQIFLKEITNQINFIKNKYNYKKGIFRNKKISSIHEFSFLRLLIYSLIRHYKPRNILETGVYYGGNTIFILKALKKNKKGKLVAIDLPDRQIKKFKSKVSGFRHPMVKETEKYTENLLPGFIIPKKYKFNYELILGEATKEIKKQKLKFDFYIHDSDHSFKYLINELKATENKKKKKAFIVVDDIDWSNAFYSHVCKKQYYPIIFSDNGKDNLRSRIGMIYKSHPNNSKLSYTY